MPRTLRAALALAALAVALVGCNRETGGGEAKYLHLFNTAWAKTSNLGLYEVKVASVMPLPDGMKVVTVNYLFNNGMVPDQGRAAMLVSSTGHLASDCVVDLIANLCLCGAQKDWHDGP